VGQNADSPLAQGMNMGILALLVVILSVLVTIAGFFVFLARRSALVNREPLSSSHRA
jgi:hypothetical protein